MVVCRRCNKEQNPEEAKEQIKRIYEELFDRMPDPEWILIEAEFMKYYNDGKYKNALETITNTNGKYDSRTNAIQVNHS